MGIVRRTGRVGSLVIAIGCSGAPNVDKPDDTRLDTDPTGPVVDTDPVVDTEPGEASVCAGAIDGALTVHLAASVGSLDGAMGELDDRREAITRARAGADPACADLAQISFVLTLAPGEHLLDDTWEIAGPSFGGELDGVPVDVTFRSDPAGVATVNGGRSIELLPTDCTDALGPTVCEVSVDSLLFSRIDQVFVDGRLAVRAREPDANEAEPAFYVRGPTRVGSSLPAGLPRQTLGFQAYEADVSDLSALSATRLEDVSITVYHSWEVGIDHLAGLDPATSSLTLGNGIFWGFGFFGAGQRYHLENYPAALDTAGEWFFDPEDSTLAYLPGAEESPLATGEPLQLWVPRVATLLHVHGELAADGAVLSAVRHIRFEDLRFRHGAPFAYPDSTTPPGYAYGSGQGGYDFQSGPDRAIPGSLALLEAATDVSFTGCTFEGSGGWGIVMRRGVQDAVVSGSRVAETGAGSLLMGELASLTQRGGDDPRTAEIQASIGHLTGVGAIRDNLIEDNVFASGGHIIASAPGVILAHASNTMVRHNAVYDFAYSGVSVGWEWQESATDVFAELSNNNLVEENHIFQLGRRSLNDFGGVYTLAGTTGTEIRDNVVHDVFAAMHYSHCAWGIYDDQGTADVVIEGNLVFRTSCGGYVLNFGRDIQVDGNLFAFGERAQLGLGTVREDLYGTAPLVAFTNNSVIWDDGPLLAGRFADPHSVIDGNSYDDLDPATGTDFPAYYDAVLPIPTSFEAYRDAFGHDAGSTTSSPWPEAFAQALRASTFSELRTEHAPTLLALGVIDAGPMPSVRAAEVAGFEALATSRAPLDPPSTEVWEDFDLTSGTTPDRLLYGEIVTVGSATHRFTDQHPRSATHGQSLELDTASVDPGAYAFVQYDLHQGAADEMGVTVDLQPSGRGDQWVEVRDDSLWSPYAHGPSVVVRANGTVEIVGVDAVALPVVEVLGELVPESTSITLTVPRCDVGPCTWDAIVGDTSYLDIPLPDFRYVEATQVVIVHANVASPAGPSVMRIDEVRIEPGL